MEQRKIKFVVVEYFLMKKTKQNKRNGLKMWITKWGRFNLVWFQYHNYTQWKHHVSVERFWSKTEMEHENLVIW